MDASGRPWLANDRRSSSHRLGGFANAMCLFIVAVIAPRLAAAPPKISYIIPDIGTPGMNTYVEIVGPARATGIFGYSYSSQLSLNNPGDRVRVVCVNPADSAKIVIGPLVVSWQGRLISTEIFVLPGQSPNSASWYLLEQQFRIGIQVIVDGQRSNVDSFYIVQPHHGFDWNLTPGLISSRSRRGALIIDSVTLAGDYTVDTADCDPLTAGNQGFLPCVLMSPGRITIAGTVSVNASTYGSAGPGGGGGGNGLTCGTVGGSGFTGGGGCFSWKSGCGDRPAGLGTGLNGASLNGVYPGGTSLYYLGGGGGTGHPFGASSDSSLGLRNGYGGGSSGPEFGINQEGGGGGGGYSNDGGSGGHWTFGPNSNGGSRVGNACVVPIAGGSGGGGGTVNQGDAGAGTGGGGGGALRIAATKFECLGRITALGGAGTNAMTPVGAGGGGSGGMIDVESRLPYASTDSLLSIFVSGGPGGTSPSSQPGQAGGAGAAGRIRLDGPASIATWALQPRDATQYRGPSVDTLASLDQGSVSVSGYCGGSPIQVYWKTPSTAWQPAVSSPSYQGNRWVQSIDVPASETIVFVVAAQVVPLPNESLFTAYPALVMSQVSALMVRTSVGYTGPSISAPAAITLSSDTCVVREQRAFTVVNVGKAPLVLQTPQIGGPDATEFSIDSPRYFPVTVAPGDSLQCLLGWVSVGFGKKSATVSFATNDSTPGHNPFVIVVNAVHHGADLMLPMTTWNPGNVCVGQKVCIDFPIRVVGDNGESVVGIDGQWSDSAFQLIRVDPPDTAFTGTTRMFRLCFSPTAVGLFRETLTITSQQCNRMTDHLATLVATGAGVQASLTPATQLVNFPGAIPGTARDTVIAFGVSSSGPMRLKSATITPAGVFTILQTFPALPAAMQNGDTLRVAVHFVPSNTGNDVATLTVDAGEPCALSSSVTLTSGCLAAADMQAPVLTADVGDTVLVKITMRRSAGFAVCGDSTLDFKLRYRRSLLAPAGWFGGYDSAEFRIVPVQEVGAYGDSVLVRLPFIATLGDTDRTALTLESVYWYGGAVVTTLVDGMFVLRNVCQQGGSRYVTISGGVSLSQNVPNPFTTETVIGYELNEPGRTQVALYDVLGRRVANVFDGEAQPGRYQRTVNAAGLAPGPYLCVLTTAARQLRRVMVVER